jgi:hypothetical protein
MHHVRNNKVEDSGKSLNVIAMYAESTMISSDHGKVVLMRTLYCANYKPTMHFEMFVCAYNMYERMVGKLKISMNCQHTG